VVPDASRSPGERTKGVLPQHHPDRPQPAAYRRHLEETGIALDPTTLRHVLSIHQRRPGTSHARIEFAFQPRRWDGEPANAEPQKHSELVWAAPSALPPDTVDYTAAVITAAERGIKFTLNGW